MNAAALPPVDSLVFDLDGTLWDTCASCALGWNLVARRHAVAFREVDASDVRRVVGKPHDQCIRETFRGVSEAELRLLIEETMVEDNRMVERHGGVLYDGVHAGLVELANDYPLFIVSNCQAGYIDVFLAQSGLATLFRDVECWGNTGRSKPENLRDLIGRNRLARAWYVGDAISDLEAARACGVPFVHAAYGFGELPETETPALRLGEFMDLSRALAARRA